MTPEPTSSELAVTLQRTPLPTAFRRHTLTIAPGHSHPYDADEWAGAIVLVADGTVEVEGHSGSRYRFGRHSLLRLNWAWRAVHNPGPDPAVLTAIRRAPKHASPGSITARCASKNASPDR